jgi:hypothetical protein
LGIACSWQALNRNCRFGLQWTHWKQPVLDKGSIEIAAFAQQRDDAYRRASNISKDIK